MSITNYLKRLWTNKQGNVALTFAIGLLPVMLSVGAAIDYSRVMQLRTKIAHATDAALLAATAKVMDEVNLEDTAAVNSMLNAEFEPFFLANMANVEGFTYSGYTLVFDPGTKSVNVDIVSDYETAVLGIIGKETLGLNVAAATGMQVQSGGAFSMFLVLDRSGSMGWTNGEGGTKMDSLQTAVNDMISNLQANDPDQKYVRIGAVAYSSHMWSVQPIKWNLNKANDYVQDMYSDGGTDSSDAVDKAYKKLKKPSELTKHMNKNGQVPDLVMVFMTDGDNNSSADDTATINTCNQAKNYGIEIYTVAFQAPTNGQALLSDCATDAAHYFEPENTADLIEAFKNIGANTAEKLHLSH